MADDPTVAAAAASAIAPKVEIEIPVQSTTPEPVQVATEEPLAPVVTEPAPAAEPAGTEQKPTVQKLPEWAQKKIADEAFAAREAKRRADAAEAELAALRAKQTPAPATQADADAAKLNAPAGGFKTQADFDAAVAAEASKRETTARQNAEVEAFNARSNDAYNKGIETFGDDFKAAVGNLQQVGVMQPDLVSFILETEDPAKVLFELGRDPDKAAALLDMTPAKRAIEIARLSTTPATPKTPAPVSQAPAPVRPVEGSARVSTEPRDDDDDQTWFAKREAQRRSQMGA